MSKPIGKCFIISSLNTEYIFSDNILKILKHNKISLNKTSKVTISLANEYPTVTFWHDLKKYAEEAND